MRALIIVGILIVFLLAGSWLFTGGRSLTFGCSQSETVEALPSYASSSIIQFEVSMDYVAEKHPEECSPIASKITGWILQISDAQELVNDQNYEVVPIGTSSTFKLVSRVYVSCNGLSCLGGDPGDYIILQDSQGKLWRWTELQFYNQQGKDSFTGVYYVNGKRVDYVKTSDFTPPLHGNLL